MNYVEKNNDYFEKQLDFFKLEYEKISLFVDSFNFVNAYVFLDNLVTLFMEVYHDLVAKGLFVDLKIRLGFTDFYNSLNCVGELIEKEVVAVG